MSNTTAAVLASAGAVVATVSLGAGVAGLSLSLRSRRRTATSSQPVVPSLPSLRINGEVVGSISFGELPNFSEIFMPRRPSVRPDHDFYAALEDKTQSIAEKWLAAGLSTEPANRPEAEDAIREFYSRRNLTPPTRIIWAKSPKAAVGISMALRAAADGRGLTRNQIIPENRSVRGSDVDYFTEEIISRHGAALRRIDAVGSSIMGSLPQITGPWHNFVISKDTGMPVVPSQFDATSWAYYEMLQAAGSNRITPVDRALMRIALNGGPWLPLDTAAVICERPSAVHFDDQGRLHNPTGPAVLYPDGWALHAWHDVRVPADLIEGEPWTAKQILTHPNTEVRRAAIEKVGWDQFIDDAGLQPIGNAVPDPGNPGQQLALYDTPTGLYRTPVRVLLCANGSLERDGERRRFGLTVPARFKDPVEAAAWTFGWTAEQYAALEHRR